MAKTKRLLLILLVLLGPGSIIYFIAKNVKNHFIELPYLGYEYTLDDNGNKIDSSAYQIPAFQLTRMDGQIIDNSTIAGNFIVLSTIQNNCPKIDECGLSPYLFNEIFFHKLVKNRDNYNNVKVISILTDQDGQPLDSISDELKDEMIDYDKSLWWFTTGETLPFYNFNFYGKKFKDHPADPASGEIGKFAFTNSLILIDDKGFVRAVTGAKSDSDIRNFFDMLKLLKKEEFDRNREQNKK